MRKSRPESLSDKIYRLRGMIIVMSVPLLLICLVLLVFPGLPNRRLSDEDFSYDVDSGVISHRRASRYHRDSESYAVIFDAGSSGSRVHVYCFDSNLNLLPIDDKLELFLTTKPGLSAYAKNPQEAADSLKPLLDAAEKAVPPTLRSKTPVRVGATAGLRALEGDASERILQAVKAFLAKKSSLKFKSDWVNVLDGTQEGTFQWVTINYLLGNLGNPYSETVGVVDLGGGSVQMAYAISEKEALAHRDDSYVKELFLKGTKYYLYVYSYLHYGLLAARAEILKSIEGSSNPCTLNGYQGSYKYSDADYKVSSSGSNFSGCSRVAVKALKIDDSICTHTKCTFGGIWNGGGGDGQKKLFVASFFFDKAVEAGFVDPKENVAKVKPSDFQKAAKKACQSSMEDAKSIYPDVEESNLPYLCMDLVYQYSLLVNGFGLDEEQEITLVKKVKYGDSFVEAAWPLGSAIEIASSAGIQTDETTVSRTIQHR